MNITKEGTRQETHKRKNVYGDVIQRVQEGYDKEVKDKTLSEAAVTGRRREKRAHSEINERLMNGGGVGDGQEVRGGGGKMELREA